MTLPKRLAALSLALSTLAASSPAFGQTQTPRDRRRLAEQVRAEFLHAWRGYERYAWGHDELKPLSKTHRDWYEETLLMTPVDAALARTND